MKTLLRGNRLLHLGRRPGGSRPFPSLSSAEEPDWKQANPRFIERALEKARRRPSGGWYVLGATPSTPGPHCFRVAGQELVAWRGDEGLIVAPAACPHMGADLSCGHVRAGKVVCPWHGLALGADGHGRWKPLTSYDDGVLLWVQLPEEGQTPSAKPFLPPRPSQYLAAVISMEARCDPDDVVANRLDPWHGAHYHPHSFAALRVLEQDDDVLTLRVSFRVLGPLAVEVDCTFHSPEPRTIVMTIIDGEGTGSVVETHGTPLAAGPSPGRCQVIEATLATSDRAQTFLSSRLMSPFGRLAHTLMEYRARRLWVEDIAYAERRYALRQPS